LASQKVHELNELNFESMVLQAPGPVLVDFTARWCPPCRALSPIIDRVAAETWGRVRVCSVDADACPNLASQFGIRGLPTLVVFTDGREAARRIGLTNEEGVRRLLGAAADAPTPPYP
jgi:thioredoxin